MLLQRLFRRIFVEELVLGMVHLKSGAARTDFAKAAQLASTGKVLSLGRGEMKKSQSDNPCVILYPADQTAASAKSEIATANISFDDDITVGLKCTDRRNSSAIQIADG